MNRLQSRPTERAARWKRVEAELADKRRLQQLLSDLSVRFVALPSAQFDAGLEDALRLIVETFGLDRSTLWQVEGHSEELVLSQHWQRRGGPPLPSEMTMSGHLPWVQGELTAGRPIRFSRVEDLPPKAVRDLETFRRIGSTSGLAFPLVVHGRTFGALSVSTVGREHQWRDEDISELGLVAQFINNVLSRERAERREEQVRDELSHAMRVASLGELVATLTHELNQPLAAILSNAQAARRFIADGAIAAGEIGEILDDIVRDDKRAGAVIQNLRTMVSKLPKARERCSLNEIAAEVADLLRGEFVDAKIEMRLALAAELPAVEAVRVEMQQLLVNLLLNAVHAMRDTPGGQRCIDVGTRVVAQGN